tara:strand:- start:141 stop:413 length:273 start_codon:yes stop_codon:yes gene_type:complete
MVKARAMKFKIIWDKKDQPTLEEAQEFVGGWVETVRLKNGDTLLIDEEGKLKGKEVNKTATSHFVASYGMTDVIAGDAMLIAKSANTKWR